MTHGVYLITCTATGDQYVGRSTDLDNRWYGHQCQLRKGTHGNLAMQELADKYSVESFTFEVLATHDAFRFNFESENGEREWIRKLQPSLNRTTTEKMRAKRLAEWTPERRKAHSDLLKKSWARRKGKLG